MNNALIVSKDCLYTEISKKEVKGIFRYTTSYNMPQDILPKIQNIIIYKNLSVSLDFQQKGNLAPIHSALNTLTSFLGVNTSYIEDNRAPFNNNQVIRIDSNVIESIYYLGHLYEPVSCGATNLILSVMLDYYKILNKEAIDQSIERRILDLDIFVDEDNLLSYDQNNQCALNNMNENQGECREQEYKEVLSLKKTIREMSLQDKEEAALMSVEVELIKSMYEDYKAYDPYIIDKIIYDKKYEELTKILDNSDECLSYLNSKYPQLSQAIVLVMNKMNNTITSLEDTKGKGGLYYKTVSWTSDFLNSISDNIAVKLISYGSLITAVGTSVLIWKYPSLKEAFKGVKEIAGITKAGVATVDISGLIVKKLLPISLPETITVNHEELIKHFTCKFTLSNGNKRIGDLNEESLEIVGDIFGKYVYYTTVQDSQQYTDQLAYTNYLLDQLSNTTHIEKIKLHEIFNGTFVNTNNNETVVLQELIGHYNESACFDNIMI